MLRLVRHPRAPLRARVSDLRHSLTGYDAAYLALADALDDPVRLTADAGLAACTRRSLGAERVRWGPVDGRRARAAYPVCLRVIALADDRSAPASESHPPPLRILL